ncbi:hypothetical protein H072_3112 [Dactylellina haptotyla CBS 200.50]|uniref:Uncharacterized protein n=1 Tax=Dactylellina haptotyla (strain CBS 200.50) TaxID=1284197 RepID=S8AJ12_DACHA|nr:hypothetical protein H072_3112 [Dactylellina haptotyla CBS 200.50]
MATLPAIRREIPPTLLPSPPRATVTSSKLPIPDRHQSNPKNSVEEPKDKVKTMTKTEQPLKEWEWYDDEDPYLPISSWNEHPKMLLAFAEHVLSRAKELSYQGGTSQDRLAAIQKCNPVPRSILLKLVGDDTSPSPNRNHYATISNAPWYPAADVAEALFANKHLFTEQEWYTVAVFWFEEWTGFSMAEAWKLGVGRKEWEDNVLQELIEDFEEDGIWFERQPRYRRRFKAWAWWREDGYCELSPKKRNFSNTFK